MKVAARIILACVVCSMMVSAAVAQKRRASQVVPINGIYGGLEYGAESGDIGGIEIIIIAGDGPEDFYATFQEAQGVPFPPVLVKLQVKGNNISFTLPANKNTDTPPRKYSATITTAGLTLKDEEGEKTFLKRKSCR